MTSRRGAFWSPGEAAASLAVLAGLERALAHLRAGWAPKMPGFDAKLAFALQAHRAFERTAALHSRLNGLCYATAGEATFAAGWQVLMMAIDRAPSPAHLAAAVYREIYPQLIALYREHARRTDPIGDRGSRDLIAAFLPALEEERRQGLSLAVPRERVSGWLETIAALWKNRHAGKPLTLAQMPWPPQDRVPAAARPAGSRFCDTGSLGLLPADPLRDPQGIAMFLHKEIDEEYTTLELMARNSYEHPAMPWAFHRDMLRQAADEARHAMLIARLMEARNIRHGDYPLTTASYDGLYEFAPCPPGSRQELLWRMLIRQTFMEGLAVDNLAHEIAQRRAAGQDDIAAVFEYILSDEVFHARSGLVWSKELLGGDDKAVCAERETAVQYFTARAEAAREAYVMTNLDAAMAELTAIEAGKTVRDGKLPDRPLNSTGRRQAGYSPDDIAQVVSWGYAEDKAEKT
jgi:uncharacterized ferritin-like protein (DUF455 family)